MVRRRTAWEGTAVTSSALPSCSVMLEQEGQSSGVKNPTEPWQGAGLGQVEWPGVLTVDRQFSKAHICGGCWSGVDMSWRDKGDMRRWAAVITYCSPRCHVVVAGCSTHFHMRMSWVRTPSYFLVASSRGLRKCLGLPRENLGRSHSNGLRRKG